MTVTLAKALEMTDQDAKSFHPEAVASYRKFLDEVSRAVPLESITDDDAKRFLSGLDLWNYEYSLKSLTEWLAHCRLSNDESTLKVYPSSFPVWGTLGFKQLLGKIHRQKQREVENGQMRRELRRMAAESLRREGTKRDMATLEATASQTRIAAAMEKLKSDLANVKKPDFNYPPALAPYLPHEWCHLEPPEGVENWAVPQILERIPPELRGRVSRDLSWEWLDLPYCEYTVIGEHPCLSWLFRRIVLVSVALKLKNEPAALGAIHLGPIYWENKAGFIAPVVLLALLARGDLAAPGIDVTNRLAPFTVFKLAGYPEEIPVHDLFRKYLKDVVGKRPLHRALLKQGLIDGDVASLIKTKLIPPGPSEIPAGQSAGANSNKEKDEILATLLDMGFKKDEVEKALQSAVLPIGLSTEDKVKNVLAKIGV